MDPDHLLDLSGERWRRWDPRPGAPGPLVADADLARVLADRLHAMHLAALVASRRAYDPSEREALAWTAAKARALEGEWTT